MADNLFNLLSEDAYNEHMSKVEALLSAIATRTLPMFLRRMSSVRLLGILASPVA